jgi:replicative DNA helicase
MELKDIPNYENVELNSDDDNVYPISELAKEKSKVTQERYPTGFIKFNEAMDGGYKNGDLVIIAGMSGHGKTTFSQTLTYHLCKSSIPCLWISYETGIEYLDIKFRNMGIGKDYFAYAPKKNMSGQLKWIKEKIQEAVTKYGVKAVFIDHLGFLTPTNISNRDNETLALTKIARELKTLAVELNIIIFSMAHIRKIDDNKAPTMQDIAYSSGIYQEADYVLMIWRLKNKSKQSMVLGADDTEDNEEEYSGESKIKMVKSRSTGKTPIIPLLLDKDKFYPINKKYEHTQNQKTR